MKNYRLVEIAPENGKRAGKRIRVIVWSGPDREEMKRQIKEWCAREPRKPYADIFYYHGVKRIYAYEL